MEISTDWTIPVKQSIRTCKWYSVCPIKRFTDAGLLEPRWVDEYCKKANPSCVRFQMEEKGLFHPDNMLPDGTIDPHLPR